MYLHQMYRGKSHSMRAREGDDAIDLIRARYLAAYSLATILGEIGMLVLYARWVLTFVGFAFYSLI